LGGAAGGDGISRIHCHAVSTPAPEACGSSSPMLRCWTRFRLVYELKGAVMSGKFKTLVLGPTERKFCLERGRAKVSPAP
jgi:hypothetical protein